MGSTPFWPTRKDSEPRPRIAWAGSAAKRAATFSLLGTSTKLLSLTNRPRKKPRRAGLFSWPTRKDSEPRPRIARAGSAAKADFPFCSLGASTQLLALTSRPTEKTPTRGVFSIGLPERIRTFDLQSRSLTRYPAVPRVGMKLYPIIIAYLREKCKPFLKKSRAARSLFARLFPTKDPPRRGLDPCGKLSLYLWISPQVFRKVSHTLWKTLWTSRPKS